jgi:hypothetical protein
MASYDAASNTHQALLLGLDKLNRKETTIKTLETTVDKILTENVAAAAEEAAILESLPAMKTAAA